MHRPYLLKLIPLLAAMVVTSASAGIHRWVDENGQVHFGSRPPVDSNSAEVKMRKQPSTPEQTPQNSGEQTPLNRAEQRNRYLEQRQREKAERKEKKAKELKETKQRDRACAYSKDKLKEYLRSRRLYEPTSDGKRRWLSDEDRERAIVEMRQEEKKWCKK